MLAHPNDVAPAQAWVIHTRPDSQACGCTPWQTPANAWPIFYAQELYPAVPVGDSQMRHSGFVDHSMIEANFRTPNQGCLV